MAGKGGARPGAGRKPKPRMPRAATKAVAERVLALTNKPIHVKECRCEDCAWYELLHNSKDARLTFDVRKYLTDRRDGKAVQAIDTRHEFDPNAPLKITVEHIGRSFHQAATKAK